MRLFGSDRIQPLIERLKIEEGQAIEYGILSSRSRARRRRSRPELRHPKERAAI
jgi:preprotein translocase subunit SecA